MTGSRSKVVPLKTPGTARGGRDKDGAPLDLLPALLQRMLERCRPVLQQQVQTLFDQTDDALFELADRAASNAEQNLFFESMREVRIKRRGIEQAMVRDLQEGLRCLALGIAREAETTISLDSASSATLSLIDHDELEEIVAVENMVARAEKMFAEPLALLTARLAALLPERNVSLRNNPLGPSPLCNSFVDAGHSLELDIKARLVLFKLFDRYVVKALDAVYDAANRLLMEEGVLPRLKRGAAAAGAAPQRAAVREEGEAEQVFSSLQQMLGEVRRDSPVAGMETPRIGLMAPGLAPALPREALMQLLGSIQQHQMAWLARQQPAVMRGVAPQQFDVLQALNQVLQQQLPDRAVSIGQVDDDAINLVSMLFQFILEDRNLAAPIKGLIARLQIPILKVAMQDKSFFGKGGHPARKLLNEVANASLGWNPAGEVERDLFYINLDKLVNRIADGFADDIGLFQRELEDFLAFVELDRRRATLVEQRTVDAEDGRARSELARTQVQEVLAQKIAGQSLPPAVVRLLDEGWSNVMFLVCLKEGTDSESWQRALQTVDELLESVSPVESLADRARLLRTLPSLLRSLRSGLNKIGFNPFELNQLFADLEQIHLQRLKKEETADLVAPRSEPVWSRPSAAQVPVVPPAVVQPTLDEMLARRGQMESAEPEPVGGFSAPAGDLAALDRDLAESLGEIGCDADAVDATSEVPLVDPLPADDEALAAGHQAQALVLVDQLQVGGWVELLHNGAMLRCRLAAIIRATGKYIFVNRSGVKVAESNRETLAQAYRRGELRVLDDSRLFDRALESVIGNLREMRNRSS